MEKGLFLLAVIVLWTCVSPEAAMGGPKVDKIRPLCLETNIVAKGRANAVIVVSSDREAQQIAGQIRQRIQGMSGAALEVVDDESWMSGKYTAENAIAVGNMFQNKLTERLYCLWYTREDGWYPGKGGWVVRTVHNPWGTSKNVIVLAGSDMQGTRKAAERFLKMLKPGKDISIGHTIDVKMAPDVARAIRKPDANRAASRLSSYSQRSLMGNSAYIGMAYVYSGDPGCARVFMTYLMEHRRRPELGHDTHMELWKTIRGWDNLEECPALTDKDRLKVTNYLLMVLRSKEGVFNNMFISSLRYSSVRHNHHMLAAMDAYYGGHYFKKYYSLPEADDWLKKAKFCFDSQELQDKGQDESGNYEGTAALSPLVMYACAEPGYKFFSSGTAKSFIDRMCMTLDNRCSLSGHGDCWDVNCFPTIALGACAWFYRDGQYQWILEQRFLTRPRERNQMRRLVPFRMDGVVEPVEPTNFEGVTVAPLNHEHYDFYHKRQAATLNWNLPWEKTFDKISFRTKFDKDKQYLLLDGIACGSHGHFDANCIIRFTDNDRVWLVDDCYTEGPFLVDHNGVIVARDGIAEKVPACARLDAAADLGEAGISRSTLLGHSGVDWERNIIWLKERCFIVLDRMRAVTSGNYSLRCKWRTLGTVRLEGNVLCTEQKKGARGDAFFIVNGGDVKSSFTEDRGDFGQKWSRYEHAQAVVNIHTQETDRKLAAGQEFTFANLLYTTSKKEPHRFRMVKVDERSVVVSGDDTMLAGVADGGYRLDRLSLNAGAFLLRKKSVAMVLAGSLSLDGKQVFKSRVPVSVLLDFSHGRCVLQAEKACRVTIAGKHYQVKAGRNEFRATGLGGFSFSGTIARARSKAKRKGRKTVERREMKSTSNISAAWKLTVGSAVRSMLADGDMLVLGTEDGVGVAFNPKGKPLWQVKATGRINAISTGDLDGDGTNEIVFASEDAKVYAVDRSGGKLWTFTCPRYPKRRGKNGQARDVLVSDLRGDGKVGVIVGANNIMVHVLDGKGKQVRKFDWFNFDPKLTADNLVAMDINGDGVKEILAFASSGSFGTVFEFSLSGKKRRFSSDGWPSHIRDAVAGDINGDGKDDIAYGTNRGSIYYRIRQKGKLGNNKVFSFGCGVTSMAMLAWPGQPTLVVVGLETPYVHALDSHGKVVWSRPTGASVTDLAIVKTRRGLLIAVGAADGSVLFLDGAGREAARYVTGSRVAALAPFGDLIAAGCDDGTLHMLQFGKSKKRR